MSNHSSPKPKSKAPAVIAIAGWILLLGALLNLGVGGLQLYAVDLQRASPDLPILSQNEDGDLILTDLGQELGSGIINLILGAGEIIITFGFWRQQRWAWVAGISWQAIKLLFELSSIFVGADEFFGIFFAALLVFLLNQADVRRAFNILPQNESSPQPLHIFDSN